MLRCGGIEILNIMLLSFAEFEIVILSELGQF